MFLGKMRHHDSASVLANLEMTQKWGEERCPPHCSQENYRELVSREPLMNFGAQQRMHGPISSESQASPSSVGVSFSETFSEHLCQVLGLQDE